MTYLDYKLNNIQKPKYDGASRIKIPSFHSRFYSPQSDFSVSKNNLFHKERALKTNSKNLSFKGSFFRVISGYSSAISDYKPILKKADALMADVPSKMIEQIKKVRPNDIIIENNSIKFKEIGVGRRVLDAALYPIVQMPFDIMNFGVASLRKLPFLAESKTLNNLYNNSFLSKNRESIYLKEQVGALQNVLEKASKTDFSNTNNKNEFLRQVHSLFDPKKGNYSTAHERSLNRIVSGIIPAYFLANDAYNLSRYCDDNEDAANKEKKIRFNQELARVGTTAYLQLVLLSGLSKVINSSIWGAVLSSTGITIFTELFSRKLNGKPVFLLNKESAKEQYKKEYEEFQQRQQSKGVDYTYYKMPVAFKNNNKVFASFAQNEMHSENMKKSNKQKPPVTLSGIIRYSILSTAAGFAILGLRKNSKAVNNLFVNAFKPFKNKYNQLAFQDLKISKENLSYLAERFKKAGYSDIAQGYNDIIQKTKGDYIVFGVQNTKQKPIVDFAIGPFKFIWKTLSLPYNLTKKVLSLPIKELRTTKKPTSDNQILGDGIQYLMDNTKKMNDKEFKSFVDKKILSSFDRTGKSNYSNADLAVMTKLFCSTATSYFLIADHYNMVMTKSKGEDQKGAILKAKERIAQRISSIFYSTLFIDLYNNTFKRAYHASLLGMSAVTAACTYTGEVFTRISIGMPIFEKTKKELVDIENTNNNRSGIVGNYFRFMSRLTGKKILSDRVHKDNTNK